MQDEVCQANHYWFFLSEAEELQRQLGITLPARAVREGVRDDETLTETSTEGESIRPATPVPVASPATDEDLEPHHPELSEISGENTAVLSNRALRQFRIPANMIAGGSSASASASTSSPGSAAAPNADGGPVSSPAPASDESRPDAPVIPIPIAARRALFEPQISGRVDRSSAWKWILALVVLAVLLSVAGVLAWKTLHHP